jgi:hypothetical protein
VATRPFSCRRNTSRRPQKDRFNEVDEVLIQLRTAGVVSDLYTVPFTPDEARVAQYLDVTVQFDATDDASVLTRRSRTSRMRAAS